LVLDLNQEIRVEVPLLPGKTTEQVTVTATRSLLRPDSSTVGGVIDTRQVQGLPLDGRDFYELSLLLPGVVPAAEGSAASVRGSFAININGAREDANDFLLDGVYNGDPKLNGTAVSPPVDAVREFEVLSSTYDASFGRNGGGQVSVVLRSGGNQFHGTAYEFFRNAVFDARNYFAPSGTPAPAGPAQPVRRHPRRTHRPQPHFLLRRLSGHPRQHRHHASDQCAHAGRTHRRFLAKQLARHRSLYRRAVPEQHHPERLSGPHRLGHRRALSRAQPQRAQPELCVLARRPHARRSVRCARGSFAGALVAVDLPL
jgi:hypothetical protein